MLAACLSAMLTACATPRAAPPDPIVETRTVTRTICPAELLLPRPAKPIPAAGAIVKGNEAGLGFVAALGATVDLLLGRLTDAQAECADSNRREFQARPQ